MTAADLFCGEVHPSHPIWSCALDPAHHGDHKEFGGITWPRSLTLRDFPRAARVDPSTIPPRRIEDKRCYFCDSDAIHTVNDDVPTCGAHGGRCRREKENDATMNAAQRLEGPDSSYVERLTSIYVRARRRGDNIEAIGCAERILAIYEKAGVDIPALESYRAFVNGGERSNAT